MCYISSLFSRPKTESSTTKRVRPLSSPMIWEVNGRTSGKCLHGLGFLREMAWTGQLEMDVTNTV